MGGSQTEIGALYALDAQLQMLESKLQGRALRLV